MCMKGKGKGKMRKESSGHVEGRLRDLMASRPSGSWVPRFRVVGCGCAACEEGSRRTGGGRSSVACKTAKGREARPKLTSMMDF